MISSVEFAKFLLKKAKECTPCKTLDVMQLHKLLYICQGILLACDFDLIKDVPNAWVYGPVYFEVARWLDPNPNLIEDPGECDSRAAREIGEVDAGAAVDFAFKYFGDRSGAELSLWSHNPNGPWAESIRRNKGLDYPIDKDYMKFYFKHLIFGHE